VRGSYCERLVRLYSPPSPRLQRGLVTPPGILPAGIAVPDEADPSGFRLMERYFAGVERIGPSPNTLVSSIRPSHERRPRCRYGSSMADHPTEKGLNGR